MCQIVPLVIFGDSADADSVMRSGGCFPNVLIGDDDALVVGQLYDDDDDGVLGAQMMPHHFQLKTWSIKLD